MLASLTFAFRLARPISQPKVNSSFFTMNLETSLTLILAYTFDDVSGDTSLNNFNINNAPSYLFSVIKDIMSINPYLKVHVLPWSPVRI
jgi:hypothetical protein